MPDEFLNSVIMEIDAGEAVALTLGARLNAEPGSGRITPKYIADIRASNRANIEREKLERSRWPKRLPKPRKEAQTDAQRAKAYRDRKRAEKNAATPRVDRSEIEAEAARRCVLLEARLVEKPLPPKLRHLIGREKELSVAWMAREIVSGEPHWICRQGPPKPLGRIVEIFATHYPISATVEPGDAMRRRLKLIQAIEEAKIWPSTSCISVGSSAP